jgi:hypothetical protein
VHELCRDRVSLFIFSFFFSSGAGTELEKKKGYDLTDEEINMDLATFEREYCTNGSPE